MPYTGTSKHKLFHDTNLTHHVSDVRFGSEASNRQQQTIVAEPFEEQGGGISYTLNAHSGMAFKARVRSFELDRSNLWLKQQDSGETDANGNAIYEQVVPYEYYLTATASGEINFSNGDKREYRGARTYELNDDEDGFEVASDTFESRLYDYSTDTWGEWVSSGTPPASVLSYSSQYTDDAAKTHVDGKLAAASWGAWSSVDELAIGIVSADVFGLSAAEVGAQVSRRETQYQVFVNTPPSLNTEIEWYEAEYNSYENSTAESLKIWDGGQIIRGGFVSGSADFEGLVGYINQLDNPDELGSRVRFSATVSDLTTGEYQHENNEPLLAVDEVFELFARFRLSGDEVPLTMTPINRALSSPITQGEFTFTAELINVDCPIGQVVDFMKVGQNNINFSLSRLGHYWKTQRMVLDVYFRVDDFESLVGSIPMTGGRLSDPVILGYRTETEPEGFPLNMEYQQFEAAGNTTLTPTRKNYACVKAVPTGGTRVLETFSAFPDGYDPNDPETWNACSVRTLSPTWPDSPTGTAATRNTAYAQIPTVDCTNDSMESGDGITGE